MKKWLMSGACAAAMVVGGFAFAKGETKTVEGELVDLDCYVKQDAKGEGHKSCGEKCMKGGSPAAVLVDDKAWTLATSPKALAKYCGQQIRVVGVANKETMAIAPEKVEVQDKDGWKEVDLKEAHD